MRAIWFTTLLALLLSACTVPPAVPPSAPVPPAVPSAPGTLLDVRPVDDPHPSLADVGARVSRVSYASRSGLDDAPIAVSGVVIEPAGEAPPGGWPVVSYAHGTTGLADDCAPSRSPNLFEQLAVILPLLRRGFLVTATDYEGLGTPGPHPYLQPVSEARGVIDAVRAARELVPAASEEWVALGVSQGGQAAWAAGELAADDPGFLGAAALAPPTDVGSLVEDVPGDLTPVQQTLYPAVLHSLQLRHPELDPADYLSGGALEAFPSLLERCAGAADHPPGDFVPRTPQALEQARTWLDEWTLPSLPSEVPLFVAAGTADDLVPVDTVDTGVARACRFGTAVQYERYGGVGHPALPAAADDTLGWITDRFAGEPAPSNC